MAAKKSEGDDADANHDEHNAVEESQPQAGEHEREHGP
jgi:hypothetical protein